MKTLARRGSVVSGRSGSRTGIPALSLIASPSVEVDLLRVQLMTGHQLLDLVDLLHLLVPVVVRVVLDLLLLRIVERAARILLDHFVPDGLRRVALLRAHLPDAEREHVV